MEELIKKAEQGDAKAMLELANRYYYGNGVEQHLSNAIKYWKAASKSDSKEECLIAIQNLVHYYLQADEISEAREWAEKGMEMGSLSGMESIAAEMCEKWEVEGLELLMTLANSGSQYAYNTLPIFAQDFINEGLRITPEVNQFIIEAYKDNRNPHQETEKASLSTGEKIKKYIFIAFLVAIVLFFLWYTITPTVVIIDSGMRHSEKNVLGSTIVTNSDGEKVELKDLELFGKYVYNGYDAPLVCYNVVYTNQETVDFKSSHYIVKPNKLEKVEHLPNFFFEEPESIQVYENTGSSILDFIFGDEEIRWVIDEYITYEDLPELPIKTLLRLAEKGNSDIQLELGYRLISGTDIRPDTVKAFQLFQKSANQGNLMAIFSMGLMYEHGWGTKENPQKAFECIYKAANEDIAEAQYVLAMYYYNGYGTKIDISKHDHYIRKSAEGGHADGQAYLVSLLLDKHNIKEALDWLEKALKQSPDPIFISAIGFKLINMGAETLKEQGYKCLQYAAKYGDQDAVNTLKKYGKLN